jgi:hypothetical protein
MTTGLVEIVTRILERVSTGKYSNRYDIANAVVNKHYLNPVQPNMIGVLEAMYGYLLADGLISGRDFHGVNLPETSPFGFHVNESTTREERKIIFASATVGQNGSGPATSIHQFYSVAEAKDLVHQLLIAIAQAEGGSTDELSE